MEITKKGTSKEILKWSAAENTGYFSPKGMIVEKEEAAMPIRRNNHVIGKTGKSVRWEKPKGGLSNPKQKLAEASGQPE